MCCCLICDSMFVVVIDECLCVCSNVLTLNEGLFWKLYACDIIV